MISPIPWIIISMAIIRPVTNIPEACLSSIDYYLHASLYDFKNNELGPTLSHLFEGLPS